jgi:membrane-associated protease RseP (regulator of RpoE activity)
MNTDEGFDHTPEGEATVALLRRHAPPPPDVEHGRDAVLGRLPQGRVRYLNWAGAAVGAAAAVLIGFVLLSQEPPTNTTPAPTPDLAVAPGPRSSAEPQLVAVVRGASADGWRVDAGLKDGLRVGDRLHGEHGEYTVAAAGIFDARVKGDAEPAKGERLTRALDNAALRRASTLASVGGDPGGFFDFGAVFEVMPVAEARSTGIADGRALRVVETIAGVLRDFDSAPQSTLASKLGLREGDLMVQVNGYEVPDLNKLAAALEWSRKSRVVQATVIRNGRTIELTTR